MGTRGQFRCGYVTPEHEATVAFYRDDLQLVVLESWDRSADDRGTLFAAAAGIIEVLCRSTSRAASHCWDDRPPQGVFMVIEVPDGERTYRRAQFPSARVMVEADLRGWLPVMGVVLPEEQMAGILAQAELVLRPYVTPAGTAAFDTSVHIVTGTKG